MTDSPTPQPIDQYSPDSLLTGYSRTRLAAWLGIALVAHIVIIVLFSIGGWLRPAAIIPDDGTAADATEAEAVEVADTPAEPVATAEPRRPAAAGDIPADRRDAPVARRVTEAAEPSELPRAGDLDLRIEDTNPWQ